MQFLSTAPHSPCSTCSLSGIDVLADAPLFSSCLTQSSSLLAACVVLSCFAAAACAITSDFDIRGRYTDTCTDARVRHRISCTRSLCGEARRWPSPGVIFLCEYACRFLCDYVRRWPSPPQFLRLLLWRTLRACWRSRAARVFVFSALVPADRLTSHSSSCICLFRSYARRWPT